jgi:hypothetical protein
VAVCQVCVNNKVEARLNETLTADFNALLCARDDLSTLLSKAGQSLTVKLLLETLQQTTEFELSMAKKWATPVCVLSVNCEGLR